MLRRTFKFQSEVAAFTDAVLVAVTLLLALATHKVLAWLFPAGTFAIFDMFWSNSWLYILIVPVYGFVLDFSGLYRQLIGVSPVRRWQQVTRASLLSFAILLGLLYVLRLHMIPRTILAIHCIYTIAAIGIRANYVQPFLAGRSPRRRILLVGSGEQATSVLAWLRHPDRAHDFEMVGFLTPPGQTTPPDIQHLGSPDDLSTVLHSTVVDAVILLSHGLTTETTTAIIRQCETEGIEAWLMADFLQSTIAEISLDEIAGEPMLIYSSTAKSAWSLMFKRLMDIILSAVGLIVLSPLFLGIMLAIRLTSPGPIFFSQIRSTLRGRTFRMYKFRTMVPDAENMRDTLEDLNEVSGPVFKIKDDPRVTPVGRWLRRYSLDELPQLWNVLIGDMSIVGPRPPIPAEVEQYESWQRRRLSMRAGCTCLWQISGRNHLPFEEWMRLDLKYIDTWSLGLDFKIILKTFGTIFRGTGY